MRNFCFLLVSMVAFGCDGTPSASPDPGEAENDGGDASAAGDATPLGDAGFDFCAASAERDKTCGDAPDASACQKDKTCYETQFAPGLALGLEQCLTARACKKSDDPCFTQAGAPRLSDPTYVSYRQACEAKYTDCSEASTGFNKDVCTEPVVFNTANLENLKTCFALPCSELKNCIRDKIAATGCK